MKFINSDHILKLFLVLIINFLCVWPKPYIQKEITRFILVHWVEFLFLSICMSYGNSVHFNSEECSSWMMECVESEGPWLFIGCDRNKTENNSSERKRWQGVIPCLIVTPAYCDPVVFRSAHSPRCCGDPSLPCSKPFVFSLGAKNFLFPRAKKNQPSIRFDPAAALFRASVAHVHGLWEMTHFRVFTL